MSEAEFREYERDHSDKPCPWCAAQWGEPPGFMGIWFSSSQHHATGCPYWAWLGQDRSFSDADRRSLSHLRLRPEREGQ